MEFWDVYDELGNKLNKIHSRGEKLLDGEYHLVCECLVKHIDGTFLLMKRHPSKKVYPLCYEATAGGSALANETPLDCVKRELKEETGIACDNFIQVNYSISKERHAIYYSYVCEVDCLKDSVILQEGETIDYKWVDVDEFKDYISSTESVKTQVERYKKYYDTFEIGYNFMVIIDRPLGSIHPKHKNIVYPVNYGYIPNRIGGDNEEQDAYVLALEDIPLKSYIGRLIGVIIRIDDNETKWIISNKDFSEKEILEKVDFQEKYFKSVLFK